MCVCVCACVYVRVCEEDVLCSTVVQELRDGEVLCERAVTVNVECVAVCDEDMILCSC